MAALQRIAIIGAGAWGTALATVARRAGREVTIWARSPEIAAEINDRHSNKTYLPDVTLDARSGHRRSRGAARGRGRSAG